MSVAPDGVITVELPHSTLFLVRSGDFHYAYVAVRRGAHHTVATPERDSMSYPAEHRNLTKQKIVRSARRLFNRRGFDTVSIDDVMADAGLTREVSIVTLRARVIFMPKRSPKF